MFPNAERLSQRGGVELDAEQQQAFWALMADLRYPAGPNGDAVALIDGMPWRGGAEGQQILDTMKGVLAYHLVQAGWRVDLRHRKRKARKVMGHGMFEDAVTWVGMNEPDDPLAGLSKMTVEEIQHLPEDAKIEAMRRLGLPVAPPKQPEGWHTKTDVRIDDEPDPDPN